MKEIHASVRRMGALVGLTALASGITPAATAQQPAPSGGAVTGFSNSMIARPQAPQAQKFQDAATNRSFTLEQRPGGALLKFDDSPEVQALRATTAQRGDDFLRSDTGELIARLTEQGNLMTYFGGSLGAPAEVLGPASPFNAPPMPAALTSSQKEISTRLSKLVGHEVTVFGMGEFANQGAWANDAMLVARIGVENAAKETPAAVKTLRALRITHAKGPAVSYSADGELVVAVNPEAGYAGRPSSEAIVQAMMIRLHGG